MSKKIYALALALASSGCALSGPGAWPKRSPLGARLPAFRPKPWAKPPVPRPAGGALRLEAALAAALWYNPKLRASAWEVRAREAEALQADLLPNPELGLSAEDLLVTGNPVAAMEVTASVSQLIWLGGDREHRTRLARLRARTAGWDYEVARILVLTRTAQAFFDVLALQRILALTGKRLKLLGRLETLFHRRVQSGELPAKSLALIRTQVRRERVRLALVQLRAELQKARHHLAAFWGEPKPQFQKVVGKLDVAAVLPDLDRLLEQVEESPHVLAWQDRVRSAQAAVALAQAQGVPDLTIGGGVRVYPGSRDVGFVVNLAIPIPVFDRNQGRIAAARARVQKTKAQARDGLVGVQARLQDVYQTAQAEAIQLKSLDGALLPRARLAIHVALEAYRLGKAGYLAVLDAEETLLALEVERVQAQRSLAQAKWELELLLGRPLSARSRTFARSATDRNQGKVQP